MAAEPQYLKSGAATDTREFALHYIFVDDFHTLMAFQLRQPLCEADREKDNMTPTALVIAHCPRILRTPANNDTIIAALN